MNRNSKPGMIVKSKPQTKQISPKSVDIINILYDDGFITLVNSLSASIKAFYKTNNTHFTTMKSLILHRQPHQNIQNTFSLIEYSFNDFYTQAKDLFKKMKTNRNGNLIKLANEQNQSCQPSRCHTLGSTENTSNVSSKSELCPNNIQLKYEKLKAENNLLKKKIEEIEIKAKNQRSTSQSKSRMQMRDSDKQSPETGEMTEFAFAVNKFIHTASNVQEKTKMNNESIMKINKILMQTFDKERLEIGNMCSKYLGIPNETKFNLNRTSTPNHKKSIKFNSYVDLYNDTNTDYKIMNKNLKIEINNLKNTINSLKQDNEQLKIDCLHLNNVHIIEITKNKSLTEQLLKFESESALYNKERAMLNDKYIMLLEENDLLSLSLNDQSNQLHKKFVGNHNIDGLKETIVLLTKMNEEMKREIEQLNTKLIAKNNNKKKCDVNESSRIKNAENQLIVLNKKNMDLALKITEISKEKINIQQQLIDKDNEVDYLNDNIKYISEQIQKMKSTIETLNSSLIVEQNKNSSLIKDQEYINNKIKEFLIENTIQVKDVLSSGSKQFEVNSNIKIKEKESKCETSKLIQEEMQSLRENVFGLIKKHKQSLSIDKEKNDQIVYQSNQISELNKKITELNNQINEGDSNTSVIIAKHIDEIAKSMSKIDTIIKENNELKAAIKENQNQLKDTLQLMNKKTSEADNKIKALTNELHSQKEIVESITLSNITNEKALEELNKESQRLKRELEKVTNDKLQLENINKTLKQEKDNWKAEIDKYKEMSNANTQKINKAMEEKTKLTLDYQSQLKQEMQKQNEIKQMYEKELNNAREMIQSLIDENVRSIDEYGDKIDHVQKERAKLNEQISNLESIINDKEKDIDQLKNTIVNHQKEIEIKNKSVNEVIESNEQAKIVEEKYHQFVEEINIKLNGLKEKVEQKDKIIKIREDTIQLNQEEKEKLLSTIKSKEALINSLQEYLNKNEKSNKVQSNKTKEKDEVINQLNQKIQIANDKLQESNDLITIKENELMRISKIVNERDNELLSLQNNIKEQEENLMIIIDQKTNDYKTKVNDYINELTSKTKEIEGLKSDQKEIKAKVNNLNQDISVRDNEIQCLKQQVEDKDIEIANERKAIKAKEDTISKQSIGLNQLNSHLKEKEDKLQLSITESIAVKEQMQTLNSNLSKKDKETQRKLDNELKTNENTINELNSIIIKKEEEIKALQIDKIAKEEESNSNKESLALMNKTIEDLSNKTNTKEKEIKQLNALIKELNKDINNIKEANDNLVSQLKNATSSLEEKQSELQTKHDEIKAKEKELKSTTDSLNLFKTKQTVQKKNYYEKESDLIKEIEVKDSELIIIQSQIDTLQKEKGDLNEYLIQSKKEQETLREKLKKANDDFVSLKETYDDERNEVQEVISILRKDKEGLRSEVSRLKEELKSYMEKESSMKNLNKERTNYINQIAQLKKENDDKLNTINEQNDHLESITEERTLFQSKANKATEKIEELTSDLNAKKKEIEQLNAKCKKSTNEIKAITEKRDEVNKENNDLSNQIQEMTKSNEEMAKETEKEVNKNKKLLKTIELKDKEIEELNKEILKETKDHKDSKVQMRKLLNESKQFKQQIDDYEKERKDAIELLNNKLSISISIKDNGQESSLLQLIGQIDLTQMNTNNEAEDEDKDKEEKDDYSSDKYTLITIAEINSGLQWYLLKTKSPPQKKTNSDSYQYYLWVSSDIIDIKGYNEPIEKLNDDELKNEIKELKTSQEDLIDQLNKKETEYKKLNRQITQILGKQKITEDITQEKKANQIIDQLKEENKRLFNELQDMKLGANKNLGVSLINDNNSLNFDDSNVEELLNEMTPVRSNQMIKNLFDKLMGEIPLTPSVKCTITSILKQCQLNSDEIAHLLTKFRTGVISLPNGKLPWKNNS